MKTIKQINERLAAIQKQIEERGAELTADEISALNTETDTLLEERKALQESAIVRQGILQRIADGTADGATVVRSFPSPGQLADGGQHDGAEKRADAPVDRYDTMEYRKAFMEYCQRGTDIPVQYRTDAFTAVADAAAVIPTTIMKEIIKEMKSRGEIYRRVRKTNIKGGVEVPILSLKPTAKRITEDTPSDRQKLTANTKVVFSYYGLECKVATSLIASAVTVPEFEAQIIPLITEAMVERCEYEVFNGTGESEMLGINNDTRVKSAQKITLTAAEFAAWEEWKKKVFAKIPMAYRTGSFYMAAGTFEGHIDGMVDANGQPIGRTNYGITEGPKLRFGGREVVEVEDDIIKDYDTANVGDVVAVYVDLDDYVINSNMQMAMYRWLDHDANQYVDKALLINDGKLLDVAGVIIVKKG